MFHKLSHSQRLVFSTPCSPSGGRQAPSPKWRPARYRVSCSPSPLPSPRGEGETFARGFIIRPGLIVECLRNDGQKSEDCNSHDRIFKRRADALPLLGERVGVRGKEANSNSQSHDKSRKFQTSRVPSAEPQVPQFDYDLVGEMFGRVP